MLSFILRRLLIAIPVLFIVLSLTFLLMRVMPGNPFAADRAIPPRILQKLEAKHRLDGTLWQQYYRYMWDVVRGDLRESTRIPNRTVNEIIAQTLPVSATLGSLAFVLALGIGVTLGSYAAVHQNHLQDRAAMLVALLGISLPSFILAPLFILVFSIYFPIFPVAGWGSLDQLVLPAVCLSLPFAAAIARLMRSSMLEVLHCDFVRTARAKGLPERVVIYRHALKVSILPVVSYSGPLAAAVLTGSIVVEQIFKIPGLGPFFVNSVLNRDAFMVGGTVLVYSSALMLLNIAVDCLYFVLDRRVKLTS